MQLNRSLQRKKTHEGATAKYIQPAEQLQRSVMSCMLWEKEFYEDGEEIGSRIAGLVPLVHPTLVMEMALMARNQMKLRHVPLLLVREMARWPEHKKLVAITLERVIQRPDELSEFVSIYWKGKKQPLSGQVKKGLAKAFTKFSEYELAKYNRDREVKLRDVLFLCHAKPKDAEQEALWKRLATKTLVVPDTWEVALSSGADKKESWTRLLAEKKLGALALLRNLRNMREANVDQSLVRQAITSMKTDRVLPFRFIAAARYAPDLEGELETAMFKCLEGQERLAGHTALLVDVSGSMDAPISSKSDLQRLDAACGLAMLLGEVCGSLVVRTFSQHLAQVPPRRGFALRDSIVKSQPHSGTYLGQAVNGLEQPGEKFDRVIVITDEQSHDTVPDPKWQHSYMINVASAKNGVGYGKWRHIDGWSEAVVDYLRLMER